MEIESGLLQKFLGLKVSTEKRVESCKKDYILGGSGAIIII